MSEEQLTAIQHKLNGLEVGQGALQQQVARLESEVRSGFNDLSRRQDDLRTSQEDLQRTQDDTNRQMRVLHEDTLDSIRTLAPDFKPIRREFTEADEKLREDINRRLEPLEAWARDRRDKSD